MERLTYKWNDGYAINLPNALSEKDETLEWIISERENGMRLEGDIPNRLAAIEDILGDDYDLSRLRELVEADKGGRWSENGWREQMTEKDLEIQDLRRELDSLKKPKAALEPLPLYVALSYVKNLGLPSPGSDKELKLGAIATVCTEAVMPRLTKRDYVAIIQWLLKEAR